MDTERSEATGPAGLVFGASGYIGSHLVPRLLRAGWRVRAAARRRAVLEARDWPGAECVEADAMLPESLAAALRGIDVAYYLVHSMAAGRGFGRLDLQAAGHFAAAAAAAGVGRIVYLGGLVPPEPRSEHLVSRRETGERLRAGPVPVTEIRAGIVVGPGSAAYEVIRDLVNHLPVMVTPRWVQSRSSPIALDNLLEYLVAVATRPEAAGQVYEAGGRDFLSYEQMMREYGAVVGRDPWILRVPILSPALSAYWLALVTAVPTPIARALVGGLRHDLPADDGPLRRLVPQALAGYRDSVVAALAVERSHAVAARWVEGSLAARGGRPEVSYYAKQAGGAAEAAAPADEVWRIVEGVGGRDGYFYAASLWHLRAVLDWLVGGPGLRRGRRHPQRLRVGDMVDSWTVLALEPGRRLTLGFGMKAPGAGVLEFEVEPLGPDRSRVKATAYWHPAGAAGLAYWYVLVPAHLFIFAGMTRAIARLAEARAGRHEVPAGDAGLSPSDRP